MCICIYIYTERKTESGSARERVGIEGGRASGREGKKQSKRGRERQIDRETDREREKERDRQAGGKEPERERKGVRLPSPRISLSSSALISSSL